MLVDGLAQSYGVYPCRWLPGLITDHFMSIDTLVLLPAAYRFHAPFFFSFFS